MPAEFCHTTLDCPALAKPRLITFILLLSFFLNSLPLSAATTGDEEPAHAITLSEIEKVTNTISRKELELLDFDTRFRIENSKVSKWRSWRIFAYRFGAASATEAGMTCIALSRFKYARHPQDSSIPYLQSGHITNVSAASVALTGSLMELGFDRLYDKELQKKGFSPRQAIKRFVSLHNELDELINHRDSLIKNCPSLSPMQQKILECDGLVLKDVRDLLSTQFADYIVRAARIKYTRTAGFISAAAAASAAGYLGSLQSLLAVANRSPKQVGVAGIGFITAGSIVALTPIITRVTGHIMAKRAERNIEKILGESSIKSIASLESDRSRLKELITNADPSELTFMNKISARASNYELKQSIFERQIESTVTQDERYWPLFKERLLFSTAVGGCNLARGCLLATAGFKYNQDLKKAFTLVAAASTTYMAGAGIWMTDALQDKVRQELLTRKMRLAKASSQTELEDRLRAIQEMEDAIRLF